MKNYIFTFVMLGFSCLLSSSLPADVVVFSNYRTPLETTLFGWNVGLDIATAEFRGNAALFSPSTSGTLSQLEISLGAIEMGMQPPDGEVEIAIYSDGNNLPGTPIWSTTIHPLRKYEFQSVFDNGRIIYQHDELVPDIETIPLGPSAPMLTAGTNYWLGVQGVSGFRNVWFISRELNGQASVAFREDASQVWFTRSDDEYAGLFRVSVSVPEPNAFLGIAAIGFWGLFKRRKRK